MGKIHADDIQSNCEEDSAPATGHEMRLGCIPLRNMLIFSAELVFGPSIVSAPSAAQESKYSIPIVQMIEVRRCEFFLGLNSVSRLESHSMRVRPLDR